MTLDDFVKAGVVKSVLQWSTNIPVCYYMLHEGESPVDELYVHDDGTVSIGTTDCTWSGMTLTPTQLRALASMCLWAAEQVEAKEKQ